MSDDQYPGQGNQGHHQPQYAQQQPQYAPAPQYGQPTHVTVGYQPAPPRGLSIASMVLGLVSIVLGFTFLVPLVGFVLGIVGLRKEPAGRGMAVTGLILNGLFVVGWALLVIFVIGIGAAGIATSGTSGA
ncbi:DUF4190 domain-containing protein [Curtobacterium sp. 1310]|uniref:DUF4190 domain-containing protein n=1 Tax=Curtobacterium sp. 1310 TaxID=2806570 RepID=UPI001AE99DF3|nr:DUF4190 domain-containing protein [Curtobacterium sp. 1310]MBP1301780.1 hypothetical protein [Curtobacterium sp. 1310]